MIFRTLTVTNFGDTEDLNTRVTISPGAVLLMSARDDIRQGKPLKNVSLYFSDGSVVEVIVGDMDMLSMEQAIGGYGFED